ncbi:MAG: aminotransferase class V-fold PLP-dependent enzyme [Proteobacteria bacterium]|nr:aminotransferase class V-fold PLP-dependent enzyme [Pseudomonadota bacterium]
MRDTIFDKSRPGVSGHAIGDLEFSGDIAGLLDDGLLRRAPLGLPELSEIEVVRADMKYNPKRNDAMANLSGFRHAHPGQPEGTLPGLWEMFYNLQGHIGELMGMDAVSLQPAAGAHGELAGILIAKKYFQNKGEKRHIVLIADAAHGTNPATASMGGFTTRIIPTTAEGLMDIEALKREVTPDVAVLMLTNPSTLGLFEERIQEIAKLLHDNGSLLYYDGANMNALMGICRPGDMGFDIMHINVHKTLSTPHGGGGPGGGPVGVKAFLRDYLPTPIAAHKEGRYYPDYALPNSIGRVKAYFGHVAVMARAYAYMLTMGPLGLKEATMNAVLNANYIQARLSDFLPPVFGKLCMHECLLSGNKLSVSAYSFAKRLIDYGIHPPTLVGAGCVYFGEELKSAMLIEPTETETKESLDAMIDVFRQVLAEMQYDKSIVETAPHSSSVGKIEARAEEVGGDGKKVA